MTRPVRPIQAPAHIVADCKCQVAWLVSLTVYVLRPLQDLKCIDASPLARDVSHVLISLVGVKAREREIEKEMCVI